MAITDPTAIAFCNNHVRTRADRLAQAYHRCLAVQTRWNGLGGGAAALAAMGADIRNAADWLVQNYELMFRTEKIWFALSLSATITNTSTTISDGSPGDGRPSLTGAQATAIITRCQELQNWLLSAAGSFTDTTRTNTAYYNTVLMVSTDGETTLTVADAGNFINRCGELVTNYQANTNASLNTLLAVAVNPNN